MGKCNKKRADNYSEQKEEKINGKKIFLRGKNLKPKEIIVQQIGEKKTYCYDN